MASLQRLAMLDALPGGKPTAADVGDCACGVDGSLDDAGQTAVLDGQTALPGCSAMFSGGTKLTKNQCEF